MPEPKEVFDEPANHWDFLTLDADSRFEGQHFDRKEACRSESGGIVSNSKIERLREHIRECVSGFANANRTGGLLILGISSTGEIEGINHLSERQINSLTNIDVMLVGHAARTHFIQITVFIRAFDKMRPRCMTDQHNVNVG